MQDNFPANEEAIRDKIELSPIEKYIKFNKFPWKLVLHITLLIFTTVQVVNMVELAATYQKPILQVFKYILMDSTDEDFTQTYYTLIDYQYHLGNLTNTLSDLGSYMLNRVDSTDATYNLQVYYTFPNTSNHSKQSNLNPYNYTYNIPNITEGIKHPFDQNDSASLKTFIQTIESMDFNINNLYTSSQLIESQLLCFNWSITLQYQFIAMSHITATLEALPSFCQFQNSSQMEDLVTKQSEKPTYYRSRRLAVKTYAPFGNTLDILNVIVFGLGVASFGFAIHHIYEMGLLYMATRNAKYKNRASLYNQMGIDYRDQPFATPWEDLSFMQKFKFFDIFLGITMIGNLFQILGSVIAIYQTFTVEESSTLVSIKEACVGLGCMCCWMNVIKYLTYIQQFKSTTNIIGDSTIEFMKFLIGVIPLYLAFVFLGRCLFWKTTKFESTNQAIVTLFSIMGGDIIEDTYSDTSSTGILSTIYMTIWIILFMSAVHNVFISIISSGFGNKFLEDRYQELFKVYALGDKGTVAQWNVPDQANMMAISNEVKVEENNEDVLSLIPYIRRDSDMDFNPENRERIKKTQIERKKIKKNILEKTQEVEKLLANMQSIVNEFSSLSNDREEKKNVKTSFSKCLSDVHLFLKFELAKAQPKASGGISRQNIASPTLSEEQSPTFQIKRVIQRAGSFIDGPEPEL